MGQGISLECVFPLLAVLGVAPFGRFGAQKFLGTPFKGLVGGHLSGQGHALVLAWSNGVYSFAQLLVNVSGFFSGFGQTDRGVCTHADVSALVSHLDA